LPTAGKWYWEVTITAVGGESSTGIQPSSVPCSASTSGAIGYEANAVGYYYDGRKLVNGSFTSYGAAFTTGDVIGVGYDADAAQVTFYKNNASQGAITGLSFAPYKSMFQYRVTGGVSDHAINFGQRPFTYTPPTGFKALHTGNLPAAPIPNPKLHFDVVTRNGFGGTGGSITSLQFKPGLWWEKRRNSTSENHILANEIAGTGLYLSSNTTTAESALTFLTSLNSNGYTLATNDYASGDTLVDWCWKAGGAPVTNNAGSISAQVSANPVAGFSIVTYTGTGANATVGHGLGVAPKMVIVKERTNISGENWNCWHYRTSGAVSTRLQLNTTSADVGDGASIWNTVPSSTVFGLGSPAAANGSTRTYVAYCFSEIPGYSRISSYTGNGSTEGPHVICGFRPRWIMMKSSNDTFNWMIFDTARGTFNVTNNAMLANDSAIEQVNALWNLDILSNGFKPRGTSGNINGGGTTYIFYAIAEAPFQSALAR
jgi:hypothetical protein